MESPHHKQKQMKIEVDMNLSQCTLVCQCAESSIFIKPNLPELSIDREVIVKLRHPKKYRIPEIESSLSTSRIKQEVANMNKARKLKLNVPEIYHVDYNQKAIFMEYLKHHVTLKSALKAMDGQEVIDESSKAILQKCGEICATLHNSGLNHGDLTSSNIMVNLSECSVYLIDFGLSFVSNNIEDKAVDLYIFEKSLLCEESSEKMLNDLQELFMKGYSLKSSSFEQIINRLHKVKARGRKKVAFG